MWHSSAAAQEQNAWKAHYNKSCESLTAWAMALHKFLPDFCLVLVNHLTVEAKELRSDQNSPRDKEKKTPHSFHEILHASLFGEIPDKVIPKSIKRYLKRLLAFQTSWAYVMKLLVCAKKRETYFLLLGQLSFPCRCKRKWGNRGRICPSYNLLRFFKQRSKTKHLHLLLLKSTSWHFHRKVGGPWNIREGEDTEWQQSCRMGEQVRQIPEETQKDSSCTLFHTSSCCVSILHHFITWLMNFIFELDWKFDIYCTNILRMHAGSALWTKYIQFILLSLSDIFGF